MTEDQITDSKPVVKEIKSQKKVYDNVGKMELVFNVLIIGLICVLIPCGIEIYNFRQKALAEMPVGYEFPMISDFSITIKTSLVLGFIELFFRSFLPQYLSKYCKVQNDILQKQSRSEKMAAQIFKILYYSTATVYGYKVLQETKFQSKWLGGTGDGSVFNNFLEGYPYVEMTPLLKNYCLITMGYHLGSCYPLIYTKKKNDFLEMTLHHFACLFCYFGCYTINALGSICLINFVHDLADITVSMSRLLGETIFKKTAAAVFVLNIILWTYSRLVVLPIITYQIMMYATETPTVNPRFPQIFGSALCCLIILHVYWLKIFFAILMKYHKDGQTEDLVQDHRNKDQKLEKQKGE